MSNKKSKYRGKPCRDCGGTLRVTGEKLADHPGTVFHASSGLCSGCYVTRQMLDEPISEDAPPKPPKPLVIHGLDSADPKLRATARTTQAWLDARRARGINLEGAAA